jgi:CheY-like chemotaxis protein
MGQPPLDAGTKRTRPEPNGCVGDVKATAYSTLYALPRPAVPYRARRHRLHREQHAPERDGHEVVLALDGAAALAAFKADDFDLVITDIMMPSIDGLQVLRTLRQEIHQPKIIAISGNDLLPGPGYLSIAEMFGAVETLQKPFSNEQLTMTVRRVLGEEVANRP